MRKHDCILVRLGEIALKSRQVQRIWFSILVRNIRAGLKELKINSRFELTNNRIYIYTEDIKKTGNILKRIFGITSFSPVWVCHSNLNDIKILACDVAKEIKLKKGKSFAIAARRTGNHKFTSQMIAEEAGAAVNRVTNAKVNLSSPDKTIYIETRSKKTYVFTEKLKCSGGMPLGTGGKVLGIINDKEDLLASWLIARKGCELILLTNKKMEKKIKNLEKWHIGRRIKVYKVENISEIQKKEELQAIVIGEKSFKKIKKTKLLILRPLVCLDKKKIKEISEKFTQKVG